MSSQATSARVLLLIPSFTKQDIAADVAADRHPQMDYLALAARLRERGCEVTIEDYASLRSKGARLKDLRLALLGYKRRGQFDAIFCNSESIALPLASMLRSAKRRPRIVAIGHRITTPKKQVFFIRFNAMAAVDKLFLYAAAQQRFASRRLGLTADKAPLIAFHADTRFFRPAAASQQRERPLISAAGLEWRDYPTLLSVAERMPEVDFHIAAASPWSKHRDETEGTSLPGNVTVRRHDYDSLRALYRSSDAVAVPLYETDFQAGVTTILEAMACGKPVVVSRTEGQSDVIVDGANGLYVRPGDVGDLHGALRRLLADASLRERLGKAAREWVETNATLDRWAETIADAILSTTSGRVASGAPR